MNQKTGPTGSLLSMLAGDTSLKPFPDPLNEDGALDQLSAHDSSVRWLNLWKEDKA